MSTASAPGKVVLSGEYAVLDGAPAVCVAVNRRARARVTRGEQDWHSVTAPGFAAGEARFTMSGGRIDWLDDGERFGLVEAVMQGIEAQPGKPLGIELDTRDFIDPSTGRKIGVGSSAALTVALIAALRRSTDVFDDALEAHRRFQAGAGSGVDVAAAVHGGLIEFKAETRQTRKLAWPDGLACRFVWTGVAASTAEKLARFDAAGQHESRLQLARSAARIAGAWHSATAVLQELPAYIEDLRRFSVDHDLGIFDAGHEQLASRATAAGLVYKPCGAGGGDVGVLLGESAGELDEFLADGHRVLDCEIDLIGVERH